MSKNYIEKVIDEKVQFEPDYSRIKEQVNIQPKQASKKRWVWPSLSIGLVSIAVIVAIIVSLSLRSNPNPTPTPTPTYDGVHFNNYTSNGSGSGSGVPLPPPPMVSYSIDVEKDNYEYNEEFIIKYTIKGLNDYDVADRDNLKVKIVSDKFEFLSPTEYHFDLETDISTYGNILSFGEKYEDSIYPIEMELKVKSTKPNESLDTINMESILFLLEFPLKDEFKEGVLQGDYFERGETYKNGDDEFTKDFEWIHRFYFLNDELGTLLVDESKKFVYPSKDKENEEVLVQPRTEIMYRSLNRLYEDNLISENDYIRRIINYFTNNRTYLCCIIKSHIQDKYIV
ncbi:MAG: hypothetical protein K2H06_02890, partial [Anaeroplasmataceae bacterium]|nr:hypothetical protein [Anaeroplasmataceae bacterium]